jgi:hypothetical protein
MSGWHCEVAQVTNRLTWSSAVGLEQREDTSSHKHKACELQQEAIHQRSTVQYDGFQLDS